MNLRNFKLPIITKDMLEEASRQSYICDREYPENFSNWFPCIKSSGKFYIPRVVANQVFTYEEVQQMQQTDLFDMVDWDLINKILQPTLDIMKPNKVYIIKNGCFSNKFEFDTCLATRENLAQQLWKINYMSSLYSTGGYTELVVREYVCCDLTKYLTIYNGMPLRTEIRVFYNMDTKQIEYSVDYWDYEYCYPHIRNLNDKIVFNAFHNKFKTDVTNHKMEYRMVLNEIQQKIETLQFDGLNGIWSIDFMFDADNNKIYLIDMARGERSAYWDFGKLSNETKKKIRRKLIWMIILYISVIILR